MSEGFTDEEYLVESIIAGPNSDGLYKVKWINFEEMTWEPVTHLKNNTELLKYRLHHKEKSTIESRGYKKRSNKVRPRKTDLAKLVVKSTHHCKVHAPVTLTKLNKKRKKRTRRRRQNKKRKF